MKKAMLLSAGTTILMTLTLVTVGIPAQAGISLPPDPTPTPIPTPALLPGLVGMGIAILRKKNQADSERTQVK